MEKLEIHCNTGENVMVQPLWKTVCQFLKTLNMELSYDLTIILLDTYLE